MGKDDKPNLASIDVGFKPSQHLIETATKLRELAVAIEQGEVHAVAYTFVEKDGVTTHLSIGRQQFELAGGIGRLAYRIQKSIDEDQFS